LSGNTERDSQGRGCQARLSLVSFPSFYQQYYPVLVRYLISQAHGTRFAEDVAQETMLAAREKWEDLLTYERPDAWLFKIAIRMLRRWEYKVRQECSYDGDGDGTVGDVGVAAATDDWVNQHVDIVTGIRSLPRRQAEVIALHYLADYTITDTAEILGISAGSAKTHLHRALDHLKRLEGIPAVSASAEMRDAS